jgi:hypothetical protein
LSVRIDKQLVDHVVRVLALAKHGRHWSFLLEMILEPRFHLKVMINCGLNLNSRMPFGIFDYC